MLKVLSAIEEKLVVVESANTYDPVCILLPDVPTTSEKSASAVLSLPPSIILFSPSYLCRIIS